MDAKKVVISVDQFFSSGKSESSILSVSEFNDLLPFDALIFSFTEQVRYWLDHEVSTGCDFDFHFVIKQNVAV